MDAYHSHPDIIARQDALQTLTYRALRHIAIRMGAGADGLPEVDSLSPDWLLDAVEHAANTRSAIRTDQPWTNSNSA